MRSIFKKLEKAFAAVAFAEVGEFDTALEVAGYPPLVAKSSFKEKLEKLMIAITFAEANCHEIAWEYINPPVVKKPKTQSGFQEVVGLGGIRIWYGVAHVS